MAYAFPQLNVAQIIQSLGELCSLHLEEKQFSKPESSQWIEVFTALLCEITDTTEDCLKQHLLTADSDEVEYPDLHSESVPIVNLIVAMRRIMPDLYVDDFSGRDIVCPTSQRLLKICSAIINFLRFKHTRLPVYEAIKMEIENEREHHDALVKSNEELKQKINKIRSDRAVQEHEVAKVQDEIEAVTLSIQEQMRTKTTHTKIISELKTKITERKARADQLKCEILNKNEEEEKLSQKIVQSPAKVRAEQEGLKQQVDDLMETLQRKRHRLGEIQNQRKETKQTGSICEKGLQLLELIQAGLDKEMEISNEMSQIMDKIQEGQEQFREMNMQKERVKEMLTMRQEKLAKMSLLHQSRVKVIQEQIESYKGEKENQEQRQSSDSERKIQLLEYRKKVEADVKRLQKTHDSKVQAILEKYGLLLEKIDRCNNSFAGNWDQVRKLLSKK